MAASKHTSTKVRTPVRERLDAVMNLRVTRVVRDLIDDAASQLGKTRTDFIVESARNHAIDVLLDQRLFVLDAEQYSAFKDALDEPALPNERLKQLMRKKPVWQR